MKHDDIYDDLIELGLVEIAEEWASAQFPSMYLIPGDFGEREEGPEIQPGSAT